MCGENGSNRKQKRKWRLKGQTMQKEVRNRPKNCMGGIIIIYDGGGEGGFE
jgi:hypothetical protein